MALISIFIVGFSSASEGAGTAGAVPVPHWARRPAPKAPEPQLSVEEQAGLLLELASHFGRLWNHTVYVAKVAAEERRARKEAAASIHTCPGTRRRSPILSWLFDTAGPVGGQR